MLVAVVAGPALAQTSEPVAVADSGVLYDLGARPAVEAVAAEDVLVADFERVFDRLASEAFDARAEDDGNLGGYFDDWLILPLALYSPETELILGGTGAAFWNLEDEAFNRPSSARTLVMFSTRGQLQANLEEELWFDANRFRLFNAAQYRDWPDIFFGVGNDTRLEDEERYAYQGFISETGADMRVWESLYVGLRHMANYFTLTETEADGQLGQGSTIPGVEGGLASGVGVAVSWDDRDSAMYATRGWLAQVSGLYYPTWLGSSWELGQVNVDVRTYVTPWLDHVIALQLRMDISSGDVPFTMLPQLGGSRLLRGHFRGRYRDQNLLAAQLEYRAPLFWRFKAVAYVGVGEVFSDFSEVGLGILRWGSGLGLRFQLSDSHPAHLRFDVGYAGESFRFYFQVFESF
jgi:hypothetical protein